MLITLVTMFHTVTTCRALVKRGYRKERRYVCLSIVDASCVRTVSYINWQRAGSGSRRRSGQKSTGSLHCIIIDYKKSINIQLRWCLK